MTEEGFWDDPQEARKIVKAANRYKEEIENYNKLVKDLEELEMMLSFIEDGDESFEKEFYQELEKLEKNLEKKRLQLLLTGKYDKNNAIVSINSGTGGLDAQDWAKMLLRMYTRWAEGHGYSVEILDYIQDPEAGIKSATILIKGENAYGYLRSEKGVHRLVRISPFDSSGKRHTSFASIDVMPELEDDVEVNIDPKNLKIDTYRASGAGGQHVNKTDSAVRITHIPTGIVVQCQNQRSQHSNKDAAMKMLMGKLIELKEKEQKEHIEDLQGKYTEIAWGSQIRSYVFNPYNLAKDHRTGEESGNISAVMDGAIDPFIIAYLQGKRAED